MKKEKRIEKIYSLTPMQEGMLFHFLKDEDAVFYFEQYLFTLKGDVDVSILEKSFNILIKRHDILRTQFVYDKIQNPKQVVIEDLKLDIYFEDISRLTEEKKKAYLVSLKKEDMEKGFDLTGEILMRVYVIKTGADSYRLLWNTHHITMDGWSNGVFVDELIEVYIALKRGERPRLKPTVPFRNYVKWLEKQDKAGGINYWRQYLEGYTHSAALPELITSPANGKYEGCENDFHIDERLTSGLTGMAADFQVTLNTVFQTLWGLLLHIYNNTDDVVFGTVVSGRPPEIDGIEKMVGLFINSIPVRIKSSPGQLFSQLLTDVHKNAAKSKSYEYLPLADIQECAALKRTLINHLLTFENYPVEAHMRDAGKVKGLGFGIEEIDMFDQINYNFDIIVIPGKSLSVKFSFNRLVYEPGYVKQVEFHFRQLIDQVVDNPHIPLGVIDILSKEEKKQLLIEFNNTSSCFPDHKTIHELFEDRVGTGPDRIAAVSAVHLHLTYRQLNEGADRLANYLDFEKKIQPGRPVGILMERSCDYITAILGILKAGGAYAPISLSFPPERIKYVVDDAAINVVISQKKYVKLLNRLQWECPSLKSFLVVDTWDNYSVGEIEKDELRHEKELWHYMGQKATDEITGGGWLTSYTGEPFSKAEMDEYGDSTLKKLQPLLHNEMRVLEIGCASGITMYRIAPHVGFYYGADLSSVIIEKNRERNRVEGIENIALACVPAHQIDSIEEKDFDMVIINSVIQDFQEYNYLRKALRKAVDMLGNNGYLFVGDIMDLDLKEQLIRELVEFKAANRGRGYRTKTDFSSELFVSREFFEDFQAENKVVSSLEFSGKIFTIENELTKFRYDALFRINKTSPGNPGGRTKHKYQDDLSTLAKYRGVPLKRPVEPSAPAYVLYTSGTTGKPNGVVTEHRNVVNLLTWFGKTFQLTTSTHALQLTEYTFDPSVEEVFGALLHGGVVYVPDRDLAAGVEEFRRFVDTRLINIVNYVPTVLEHLLGHDPKLESLQVVITGGEPLKISLKDRLIKRGYLLYNNYGPTEITVDALSSLCSDSRVTIGKPVSNMKCYILDKNSRLQPVGAAGELYISGDGVSRGYMNNPGLTAERFEVFGEYGRTYRTGDQARWLPGGDIEFRGRVDHQVKIRGFRVELGEIENHLTAHSRVKEAVVVAQGDGEQKILCAYYVDAAGNQPEFFPSIKEYLEKKLPDYMIPSFFIKMNRLPLTYNGKIDRKALPLPGVKKGDDHVPPRNAVERSLVSIWSEVLGIKKEVIGIDADFFEIGGHSLKATILVSRIHKELNVKVPLKEIFKSPSIRKISAYIQGAEKEKYAVIEPAEKKEYYVLSSAQKRLYVLQRLDPGSAAYNMLSIVPLEKDIDVERLEETFRKLIARHESLRTSFQMVNNQPVQKVHEAGEVTGGWSLVIGESEAGNIVEDFNRSFDLSQAPILRVGLTRTGKAKFTLVLALHHIITDGTSHGVLTKEFQALYAGEKLPLLRLQYKDYAEWQNSETQQALIKEQEAYWLNMFAEDVQVLNLPADYPRPSIQSFKGSSIEFNLSGKESSTLKVLAKETGATLFINILSVFTLLLSRLSGQEDIVVGTPVAARRHADLEKIIGMFVNTLALRNNVPGEASYREFVKELRDRTLKAYENQEYQFETLVEKINVVRDISRNPVFDVMFNLLNMEDYTENSTVIELENPDHYNYVEETSKFDLTLTAVDFGERIHLSFEYCTKLFKQTTIERFISYFKKIVAELSENIDQNLSEIEIINQDERDRILYEFNNTEVDYPGEKTIHELFAEQVERTPDRIAVFVGQVRQVRQICLSYRELNEQSDRLAGLLIEKGVAADSIVGIMMERSVEMIVGIMGILKAGGAYLPIDPDYPQDRIDYMLKDSSARIMIGRAEERKNGRAEFVFSCFFFASSLPRFLASASSNLAYIIYTSGTTGKPKGVLIEHKNVVRLLFNDRFQFDFNDQAVWSLFHSYGFDFSVWEMYGALLYGGRLVVIAKMIARDPQQFLEVLINQKVTVLNQTPSAFYNLIDEELKINGKNLCLRYVIFGGEALKPARLKTWWKKYPETKLVNMFGITETCVHVTYKEIGEIEIEGDISNIGKPIPTLSTYIMDRYRELAPIGTPGELYVGGEGVARGYLNRPELTSDRFVENSYKAGERLYRSGDLARICTEGEMVYLGRVDQQVQLRGFRIELGEIENRLLKHDGIKEAVVIERSISSGDSYLCAYIVPQPGGAAVDLEAASIREFLSRQLPDYMIPSYFVHLEEIPLTSNGKIDRRRLPQPEVRIEKDHKPPRNKTEETLADAWQGILGLESVGIGDNFFDVGGDSIKAIRLISRINERLNSNLKIVDLYTNRTIGELAGLIDREESESVQALYRKVTSDFEELKKRVFEQMKGQGKWNPDEVEDIYPMSEIEKGMVFSYMKYAGTGIYHDQFVYPLYYKDFDIELFKKTLTLLVKKNEILRTGFNLDEFEEPVQVVYKEPRLELVYTDLAGLSQDDRFDRIEAWLSEDRRNPFESSKHLLWRMHIFSFGNHRLYLLLTVHHAILDGWSNSILMTDLHNTYFELRKNPRYVPVKLKSGNKDMVIEERVEKENTRAARYWKEELRDYIRLEFSETLKNKGELEPMKVFPYNAGMEILEKAKQAAVQWNTSVKNLFFSAYAFTMRMFSYENDMVLGCVTHNRPGKLDGDNILGCFLNTTPVRLKIPASLSWKEYAVMVERKMLEVKRYERLPLFEIALAVGEKSKDRNPIFDTLFNFTDFHILRQVRMDESGSGIDQGMSNSREIAGQFDTNTLFDFEVDITTGSLSIHPKYNAQVIGDNIVKKCCIYFVNILEKYINEPDNPARRDDILPLEEKEDLLQRFNDTRAAYSREKTMFMLFEEQVLKTQDNTAVIDVDGLRQLTYRELNEQSNRLANGLRKMGVGVGDFVGVVMERRMEMVAAVMAILKAGGAYAPLEPYLPDRRIEKILGSLKSKCVITDSCTRPRLEAVGASLEYLSRIVSLDKMGYREFKDNPVENPAPASGPGDISYVIYTSGSTGTPKGVVETHRPVVNVLEWVNKTFNVGEKDKLLFVASLGFDLSVYDIFGILSSGGSIRTAGSGDMKEPLRLLEIIVKEGITFWDSAPAALQRLVPFFGEVREDGSITRLRLVFLSGDWIPVSMPDALKDAFKGVRVISLGGATEATVWSNYYPIGDVDPSWPSIPYGKPIQNAKYYILDTSLDLCPIKIAGDLYIGGECLAKEYKNDPGLTAEKFIQNPFCAGEMLYKTGDIARWFEDGNMQFLGRKDHQVKIRGYRIELGEIESQLSGYPGIRETVVIDRKDGSGNKYICAYYTVESAGEKIAKEELISYLSDELPEYMTPAYFISIDHIPVTPNGKLDRSALPEPELNIAEISYAAPEDELQEKMLKIWKEVLFGPGEERVLIGIDDDFFQLGGHSLNATLVISKIHKTANVKVPLAEMFKYPTIRELSKVIKKSSKEKYEGINVVEKKEYYGLSSAQKRLYILQQMDPGGAAYNLPVVIPLPGESDWRKLESVFKDLIKRHESLRTSFHMVNDTPVQRIHEQVEFKIEKLGVREKENLAKVLGSPETLFQKGFWPPEAIIKSFIRPFDLSCAPLLRVGFVKSIDGTCLLLVDMHHIISDGISHQVLNADFMAFYEGKALLPLRLQYKDFAQWQNAEREKESLKRQEEYWLKEFEGEIPVLDLPGDYPRPVMKSFEGASIDFEIAGEETRELTALTLKEGATLFMVLAAVFNILLSKLSGQEEIIIGTPIAGRRHADLEKIIGMFVNTMVLRNYPSGEKKFMDFLGETRKRILEAFENQEYQYDDLVEQILVNRDVGRNPLFDTMFMLQNTGPQKIKNPGLKLIPYEYENKTSKFDLTLSVIEEEEKLLCTFQYSTKLFKQKTIESLAGYFKNMVDRIISNPCVKILEVEIISDDTRKELLNHFNENLNETFEIMPIQSLLANVFLKYKENTALEYGTTRLTYVELEHKAACISQWLTNHNIPVGSFIGIYMEDKSDIISAIIGILQRGCIFVPLDIALPGKRVENMIRLTGMRAILTDTVHETILTGMKEKGNDTRDIVALNDSFYRSRESAENKNPGITYDPEDKVYVYFTSGSTGLPNAIVGRNKSLVQFLQWEIETFFVTETYRISQLTAVGFDAFLRDIFVPLLAGGVICIPYNKEILPDGNTLSEWLDTNRINLVHCVPSLFRIIGSQELTPTLFPHLKYVLLSGEPIYPTELQAWYRVFGPRIRLVNYYGPTETTMIKTFHLIGMGDVETGRIPAGRPISGTRIIILDKHMKICDRGIMGEIYIRTVYGAHGYLDNPELNARRFIKNPFSAGEGDLIYKTGDLGRVLENGEIEVLGRIDRQVKIRGVRIELENIENCLLKHSKIERAIVISKNSEAGENFLCAYILFKKQETPGGLRPGDTGSIPAASELREYLTKELPGYMVPSYFIPIEKVPLTSNGKIDIKALPAPGINIAGGFMAPRNAMEEKLIEIWAKVLGLPGDKISRQANFFELGGHSLRAARIVSMIHQEFNVKVPLVEIFKTTTIEGLSRFIQGAEEEKFIALAAVEKKEYYRVSSAQKQLYLLQQMEPESTAYNMPQMVILEGELNGEKLEIAFRKLVYRHESLRTSFVLSAGEPVQRVQEKVEFKIEYLDLAAKDAKNREEEKIHHSSFMNTPDHFIRAFDLSKAPLLRVGLIKETAKKFILMVDMHHIVSDGISLRILTREFALLYRGEQLPDARIQYKDYTQWQHSKTGQETMKKQETYWLEMLAGEPPVLNLPTDFPRPRVQQYAGDVIHFTLGKNETGKLNEVALREQVSLYVLLLAIYTIFLAKLSGQEDIIVGSGIAGRRHADLQHVIGMFVNTLPLRNYPAGKKTFKTFLQEVKQRTLSAFDNQEYPFENMVAKIVKKRDWGRTPLVDVVFNLQNLEIQPLEAPPTPRPIDSPGEEMPPLTLKPYPYKNTISKFDMSFYAVETGDQLSFSVEYCTALYKKETIELYIEYFRQTLANIIENREARLYEITFSQGIASPGIKPPEYDFEF